MIELVQVCELFNITLKKKIQIKSWNIRATIAFPEKIDYILAILHHVVEMKSQANVKSLSSELLGSGNASIANALLIKCADLGLINEKNGSYSITSDGENSIKQELIFMPIEGTWNIKYVEDTTMFEKPKILELNLTYSELTRDADNKVVEFKPRNDRESINNVTNVPTFIDSLLGIHVKPIEGKDFRIENYEDMAEELPHDTEYLSWNIQKNYLEISISKRFEKIKRTLQSPNVSFESIWETMLKFKNISKEWDRDKRKLMVQFDNDDITDRINMQHVLEFVNPVILDYGMFENISILVDVYPKTENDAQKWADLLFLNGITEHMTKMRYDKLRNKIRNKFLGYDIHIEERAMLCNGKKITKYTSQYWYLKSMEDWDL